MFIDLSIKALLDIYVGIRKKPVDLGMYYCKSRYYNPIWCRWLNADSIDNLDFTNVNNMNLFAYCNNDPINYSIISINNQIGNSNGSLVTNKKSIGASSSVGQFPSVPRWIDIVTTAIDHSFSIVNPIRTALAIGKYENLWNLMRLDGVKELPGTLSKVATGVGLGLGILGGAITGYEKYASGASLSSSIAGGVINAGINIGGMYVATGLASLGMGLLATCTTLPDGAIVVIGAIGAIAIGIGINHLFTKLEICGNTIEGHLNNFVDWLIFWD